MSVKQNASAFTSEFNFMLSSINYLLSCSQVIFSPSVLSVTSLYISSVMST